jgi:DnaJ-class molecular chaperone
MASDKCGCDESLRLRERVRELLRREARLEALVRRLGACEYCDGTGKLNSAYGDRVCSDCDGAGVRDEAARKELEND